MYFTRKTQLYTLLIVIYLILPKLDLLEGFAFYFKKSNKLQF